MSETLPGSSTPRRRAVLRTMAWAAPTVVVSQAAPAIAASPPREFTVESNFGIGWYPYEAGDDEDGLLQVDSHDTDKYFRVVGTLPGDVLSNIFFDVHIRGWGGGALSWGALSGSNASWSVLQYVDQVTLDDGLEYRRYRSTYNGTVTATGDVTNIPIGFYFTHRGEFHDNATARTFRYVTVNGTYPLEVIRGAANIINTESAVNGPLHPRP